MVLLLALAAICLVGKEGEWHSVSAYFDEHADAAAKKRLRSLAQKRSYLEKKGFKIQKDSRFSDLWCLLILGFERDYLRLSEISFRWLMFVQ